MLKKISGYIGRLKGNARICIFCHPFWGIPFSFYYYYLSLYLKEAGVTDGQLGTLMVIGTIASLIFSLFAAPLVDRMGRKKSTLIFDLVSSALPPLLYFISGSFAMAVLATILYNSNKIMSVGYYLTMIEDAKDDERVTALNLFNIITYVAGVLIPLAGVFVVRYGVTATEKAFLLASFLLMGGMILVRDRLLRETQAGLTLIKENKKRKRPYSPGSLIKPYRESLRFMKSCPVALYAMLANVFFFAYMNLGTNQSLYFAPYFIDTLGLTSGEAALLGGLYSGGMLLAMMMINPFFSKKNLVGSLLISCALTVTGLIFMAALPKGSLLLTALAVLVLSVSYGMLKTGIDGVMAVYTEGGARSGLYALLNLASAAVGTAVTALAAFLYPRCAQSLYWICAAMGALMYACVLLSAKKEKKMKEQPNHAV